MTKLQSAFPSDGSKSFLQEDSRRDCAGDRLAIK